jgi:hypothetical protein
MAAVVSQRLTEGGDSDDSEYARGLISQTLDKKERTDSQRPAIPVFRGEGARKRK